jgi:hypothetical protein
MSVVFHVQKLLHVTKFVIKTAGQGHSFKIIVETENWARTYGWEMTLIKKAGLGNVIHSP